MTKNLQGVGGVWTAGILPFAADGSIDRAQLASFVRWNTSHQGVNAFVVNAHASESGALADEEYELLIEDSLAAVADGVGVVSGVMKENARDAAKQAKRAQAAGADAILLFPPEGFILGAPLRPEMYRNFVETVAEQSDIDICYFQRPMTTSGISAEALFDICTAVPSVIAVKEGSDNMLAYEQNVEALKAADRNISILTSNNKWLFGTLCLGGNGILSGSSSVAPGLQHQIIDAIAQNDLLAAREFNRQLLPLIEVFYRAPLIDMHSRMKVALELLGVISSAAIREPLCALSAEERQQIAEALERSGLAEAKQ